MVAKSEPRDITAPFQGFGLVPLPTQGCALGYRTVAPAGLQTGPKPGIKNRPKLGRMNQEAVSQMVEWKRLNGDTLDSKP